MSQPSDSVHESALSLPAAVQRVPVNDDASAGERAIWVRHLLMKLDHQFFRAVVLRNDLFDTFVYKDWYRDVHFGPGFSEKLLANYELVARHSDQFYVYRPRAR